MIHRRPMSLLILPLAALVFSGSAVSAHAMSVSQKMVDGQLTNVFDGSGDAGHDLYIWPVMTSSFSDPDIEVLCQPVGCVKITDPYFKQDFEVQAPCFVYSSGLSEVGAACPITGATAVLLGDERDDFVTVDADDTLKDTILISGGGGDDHIEFSKASARRVIAGGPGADQLWGGEGPNDIDGGDGSDKIFTGGGDDAINAGDGADEVSAGDGNDTIDAGPGDDKEVIGGAGDDRVDAGPGDDTKISGGSGNDEVIGGPGNDELGDWDTSLALTNSWASDDGADRFSGGDGIDRVFYRGHQPITASLDGLANDGSAGEGDTIGLDVENLTGSPYADVLTGDQGVNGISGAEGRDVINGGGGDDGLSGGSGNDVVDGQDGNDLVNGDDDDDQISGGTGIDQLFGGIGNDTVEGGPGIDSIFGDYDTCSVGWYDGCPGGSDTLKSRDGEADRLSCGPGADSAEIDSVDIVTGDPIFGCESVAKGAAPVPAPVIIKKASASASTLGSRFAVRKGVVGVRVRCAGKVPCKGVLTLTHPKTKRAYGTVRYAIKAGRTMTLRVRLTPAGRRALRQRRTANASLRLTPSGGGVRSARAVTLVGSAGR